MKLKAFLESYDPAEDIPEYSDEEILDIVKRLASIRRQINDSFVLKDGHDVKVVLKKWTAQSQIFVVDCVPYILETLRRNHARSDSPEMLDVGCASGAGTSLLSSLLATDMLWCPVSVTGIDVFPKRVLCAKNNFPDFEYVISNVFEHDRKYDYVYCSHTVEHVKEPENFIGRLVEMATRNVFVYTPYDEQNLIDGHRWSITESFYDAFRMDRFVKIKSAGWRWGKPETDLCGLAILHGGADASP